MPSSKHSKAEKVWLDDPTVLWTPPKNLVEIWPFFSKMSRSERFNSFTRLMLYGGAVWTLVDLDVTPLAIALVIAIVAGVIYLQLKKKSRKRSKKMSHQTQTAGPMCYDPYSQMAPTRGPPNANWYAPTGGDPFYHDTHRYPPSGPPPYHASGPDMVQTTNMRQMRQQAHAMELLDTNQDLRGVPLAFNGSIGSQFPAAYKPSVYNNPLDNPAVFDYDRAVRSSAPKTKVIPENMLARLFNPPGQIPFDMIAYPIPDPTLTARHPTWPQSSEEGVGVTANSACNYRMCG